MAKDTVAELQGRIRVLERCAAHSKLAVSSTGCSALDALFPARGVRQGSLVEWIGQQEGNGSGTLSLLIAWHLCQPAGAMVAVDSQNHLSAQGLATFGMDLSRIVMVRPTSERETLWVCEESLRCEGVRVVWAELKHLTGTSFRRLQLATEAAGGIGFLVRPAEALHQPSWAEVRLLVRPQPTGVESPGFRVKAVYCRGEATDTEIDIMINSRNGKVHESSSITATRSVPLVS